MAFLQARNPPALVAYAKREGISLLADDLVTFILFDHTIRLPKKPAQPSAVLVIACRVAMATFMFGIKPRFAAIQVRALSLLLILSFANRLERLKARSARQFVKMGRRDAITQLKIDLEALSGQLRATKENLAASATGACEAERALADKETELVWLTCALDERSMRENVQKTEIVALKMQVETLREQLPRAGEAAKAAEEHRDVALSALSEKELELARQATALDATAIREDALKKEIVALKTQVETLQVQLLQAAEATKAAEERGDVAVRALSEKESKLAGLTTALDERSGLVDLQKREIATLTTQIQALKERLTQVGEEARAVEGRRNAAEYALSGKELQLANLTSALNERSALADSQKIENAALRMQLRALNDQLIHAGKEARALEQRRDIECTELQAATLRLMEEREKFEDFHRHVANLVQELTAQHNEDKALDQRAREDLENRLVEQSSLLDESESELSYLREEIEIARKAEDDLRIALIEIDGRANIAIQSLDAERVQLQAALDRANGERTRLVHQLADLKRRQADQATGAERVDDAAMPEHVNDIAAERAAVWAA
jgi:chromosome segregation ATPase